MFLTEREIAQDRFLTTTNKDYCPKKVPRTLPIIKKQEFENPIKIAYEQYLKINNNDNREQPYEDGDEYLNETKEKCKKCSDKYYKGPLDRTIINKNMKVDRDSVYRNDYCHFARKKSKESHRLPEGWEVPLTTIGRDFRNPSLYDATCFSRPPLVIKPKGTLGKADEKFLKIKTGSTTYEDAHGKFGEICIRKQLHGKFDRPEV